MADFGETQWISTIALSAWLVLMFGSYRSYQVDTSGTIRMALIWGAIFAAVAFVFSLIT